MDLRTPKDLLTRLRAGDPRAFAAVYEAYRAGVHGFLLRMTQSHAVAEDLSQELWIRLARHTDRLAEDTDLGAWLYAVARNLARDHLRSDKIRAGAAAEDGLVPPGSPSPFESASATETQARLERALANLAAPDREVLLLVGVEALSHERCARVLGVSPEALRQRLARARGRLRAAMETLERAALPKEPEESRHVRH